jgi:hypothetical protein
METGKAHLFEEWIAHWSDLADFEVVPVIGSAEAAARVLGSGDPQDA